MTPISPIRPWSGRLESFWWALRALRNEVLGFRFDYPLEVVPDAGPRESLRYYVYSGHLFFDAMELSPQGIPMHRARTFEATYNPAYVGWYGLVSLERELRGVDPTGRQAFFRQLEWLVDHAVRGNDGSVVWPLTAEFIEGRGILAPPWISAMVQGLVISLLVRGYRVTRQAHLLDLCRAGTKVFEKNVEDGGVRTVEDGHALYEEYPCYPLPRVLDGFLFSLLGLYDLWAETGDRGVSKLFADGMAGLKHTLEYWNYRSKWSWYGSHGYLCPPHYNKLNAALLGSLARLTADPVLQKYANAWDPRRLTMAGRVEIFLVFLLTKNLSRLRHRTWRRRTTKSRVLGATGVAAR